MNFAHVADCDRRNIECSGHFPARASIQTGVGWRSEPCTGTAAFFYEEAEDPKDPNSPTKFYITVEGHANKQFDPQQALPNMVVQQGNVEDWIIENRTKELHAFHIHQIHFLLEDWSGVPVNEPFLLDTVNVPYWDGFSPVYPSVRLRLDFPPRPQGPLRRRVVCAERALLFYVRA